jgi:hypothetical protein
MDGIINFLRNLLGLGGTAAPTPVDPTDPCNAPACVNAKATLNAARARFRTICSGLQAVKATENMLQGLLFAPLSAIIALIAIVLLLTVVGLGYIAALLVGVWIFAWVLSFVLGLVATMLVQALNEQISTVSHALQDVISKCPEQCRGDLSFPTCQF